MQITSLRETAHGPSSYRLAWVAASDDGHPIATAHLRVFTAAGADHRTEAEVSVHPAERRRGAGTALLAEAVSGLLTDTADSNAAMRRINDALGYAPTHRSVLFQLDL